MYIKNYVEINSEECKGCRLCEDDCPNECLTVSSGINKMGYQYMEFKPGKCVACGICYYVCPELGAITVIKEVKEVVHNEKAID